MLTWPYTCGALAWQMCWWESYYWLIKEQVLLLDNTKTWGAAFKIKSIAKEVESFLRNKLSLNGCTVWKSIWIPLEIPKWLDIVTYLIALTLRGCRRIDWTYGTSTHGSVRVWCELKSCQGWSPQQEREGLQTGLPEEGGWRDKHPALFSTETKALPALLG